MVGGRRRVGLNNCPRIEVPSIGPEEKDILKGDAASDGDDADMFNLHANIDLDW